MNFFCLLILTHFCLLEVKCRSVQLDSDVHSALEGGDDKDVNHDPESNGRFSWKRLKPILRREVQRIRNVKEGASKITEESTETTSSIPAQEDGENVEVNKKEEISLEVESQITNMSSIKSELNKHSQDDEPISQPNVPEEFSANMTHIQILQLDNPSTANDFPDNIISDILNKSSDSALLQVLNDNSSKIDSLDFDETSLLSEGGHVATLQEISTVGFELLIDSETKQNTILAELLSSQSNFIDDDDDFYNSTDEDDLSFGPMEFNHSSGSELQEIATDGRPTDNPDVIEIDEDESETKNTEFLTAHESETENTEFFIDDEVETEEFDIDDETENIEIGTGETEDTEISTDEMKNVTINIESELLDSDQDGSANENRTDTEGLKCPDPGWCVFWFLALDTCAKDSHCHGTLLCCMIGCSKTCIDPDDEFL